MSGPSFASFAQNGEDVVLWRALRHVAGGRYVDVGANHPTNDSVTRAFYDRGWRGIAVEPVAEYAELFRAERPGDVVVEAALTARSGETVTLHEVPGTGLSTLVDSYGEAHRAGGREVRDVTVPTRTLDSVLTEAGWAAGEAIHFVCIDTEGGERGVLAGFDLARWRPWVLVVEATAPNTTRPTYEAWEKAVLSAGYRFCLFDGLSRFYASTEHEDELAAALSYGGSVVDGYSTLQQRELEDEAATLRAREREAQDALLHANRSLRQTKTALRSTQRALGQAEQTLERTEQNRLRAIDDVVQWRAAALTRWTDAVAAAPYPVESEELADLRRELDALHGTVSWRMTKPLRMVREQVRVQVGAGRIEQ